MKMKVNCDQGEFSEVTCSVKMKVKTDLEDFKTVDRFTFWHWWQALSSKVMGFFSSKPVAPPQLLEKPWRKINNGENPTDQHFVENYKPEVEEQNLRILLHGPVGAGKSSFFNSVNSVLQKRACCEALVTNARECSTKKYTTYKINKGNANAFYRFVLNDMMGLKDTTSRRNRRIHVKDVKQALKGHIKDGYVFNPENKLSKGDSYYNSTPTENDKVHVLVCVVDANTASLMSDATVEAIQDVRDEATELEIPQVAIFTKIDEAFPEIKDDVTNVYWSKCLQQRIEKFSERVGIPINFIFPVKNYHSERELNPDIDAIIMNTMRHIIDIGNDSLNRKLRPQT
ncbi:interferon-induced protein 44-like isoform X2 [Simochromis diagramma]|uniref:interferon-induced protein 44-like isoform X2 n=1 Tax=Simochromis diagramma TaxID=43689 RepID=UPI001A7E1D84|nr:interferon-induced protein 44-like isoform X2 [Simochromis diagramma]